MRKWLAWISFVGGLLWGIKPIYDALFNGRRVNTGYTPVDPTDYMTFILPILCLGSLIIVWSMYGRKVRISVIVLMVSIVLSACFHFFEIYYYDSDLPYGFLFLFSGKLFMIAGSISLFLQLRKVSGSGSLRWSTASIYWGNILLIAFSFLSGVLPEEMANSISFTIMILVGFVWAWFGWAVLQLVQRDADIRTINYSHTVR